MGYGYSLQALLRRRVRNDRGSEPIWLATTFVLCSGATRNRVPLKGIGARMNTYQDFSFVFGVASSVVGLCIMLTIWLAVRGSRRTSHTKQLGRQWRKQ